MLPNVDCLQKWKLLTYGLARARAHTHIQADESNWREIVGFLCVFLLLLLNYLKHALPLLIWQAIYQVYGANIGTFVLHVGPGEIGCKKRETSPKTFASRLR